MADNSRPPVTGYPTPPQSAYSNGHPPGAYSNTAYPYAAPRPQYVGYQYYAPDQRATFLRYFLVAMIAFFAIVGTMLLIAWLVLQPRLPEFRAESVTLANFSVSYLSQHVSGDWLVRFQVANPNKKMRISYTDIESYIYYESEPLSVMRLPPFDQGTRNQTVVQASFAAVDSYVDGWAVSGMNAERASGAVIFQVRLIALARFEAGWWPARWRLVRVFCRNLAVALPSNDGTGKLTGGVRDCMVGLL
ncbi:NDR1/HIN1-like protein 26 [Syzygium oleosum]|uniref:NDR1/HIN1-like protein 26 n=1 Tax=Syzygium oleosum TaxID=219896 RepID=UPI0011D2392F|nr:NDR1/HIN1-like protein 26 [Syzygium oleosum]